MGEAESTTENMALKNWSIKLAFVPRDICPFNKYLHRCKRLVFFLFIFFGNCFESTNQLLCLQPAFRGGNTKKNKHTRTEYPVKILTSLFSANLLAFRCLADESGEIFPPKKNTHTHHRFIHQLSGLLTTIVLFRQPYELVRAALARCRPILTPGAAVSN